MDEGAIPMWIEDTVLHIGAEATAISGSWMGRKAVLKKREPRAYRHPSLDRKLTRQRLAAEARILSRLDDYADALGPATARFSDSQGIF